MGSQTSSFSFFTTEARRARSFEKLINERNKSNGWVTCLQQAGCPPQIGECPKRNPIRGEGGADRLLKVDFQRATATTHPRALRVGWAVGLRVVGWLVSGIY